MLTHATRSPDSAAFRRRRRRRPTLPEPHFHHPRKGMMQPRLGTPSTVSNDRLLSPAVRSAMHSVLNTKTLRTPFHSGLWPQAASARYFPWRPELACGFRASPCDVARAPRVMRTTGFCHLLLQSRAPVPRSLSMRLPLARTESCGSARPAHPVGCAIEHPAVSRRRGGSGESTFAFSLRSLWLVVPRRPSPTDPVSCLSHRAVVPACESLRSGPHIPRCA